MVNESSETHSDADVLAELRELVRRMSPSAIPDVRARARHERELDTTPYPIYGLDSLCDYLEAVFAVLGEGGCMNRDGFDWSLYDQRRQAPNDQRCAHAGCDLAMEYPIKDGVCIRHRGIRAPEPSGDSGVDAK